MKPKILLIVVIVLGLFVIGSQGKKNGANGYQGGWAFYKPLKQTDSSDRAIEPGIAGRVSQGITAVQAYIERTVNHG